MAFELGMAVVSIMHGISDHARFDDLDLDARSQCVGKGTKNTSFELSRQLSKQEALNLLER